MESPVSVRSTALIDAIRREILTVLASSAAMTMAAATAEVALGWSERRRRHGESPSSVRAAKAIVFQVGADLVDDIAARRADAAPGAAPGSSCDRGHPGMSERVSWRACPWCGCLAAVGWAPARDAPDVDVPVEFDCPTGCTPGRDTLAQAYGRTVRPARPGSGTPG
jgi:hypothetical protein